jgi:hypothetical protein
MNFEDDMVEICALISFGGDVRVGAVDVVQKWSYDRSIERSNRALLLEKMKWRMVNQGSETQRTRRRGRVGDMVDRRRIRK